MNIAITGGNGSIGSHISKMIKELGHKVIFISRIKKNKCDNFYSFDDLFLFKIDCDIDCFIHLASPNYDYARDNSLEDGIVHLTSNILKVLNKYNCRKFIYFSSAKVYGEPSLTQKNIFNEDSLPNPVSDYGKQKLKAEKIIITQANKSNIDYIIYRMPLVYGTSNISNINKLLKYIEKSYPFIMFNNTYHLKKSLVSIENIKSYIKYNIQNTNTIKKNVFNITDKSSISLNELIIKKKKLSNSKSFIINLPYFILRILVMVPFFGKNVLKIYGHFEISNKNVTNAYKIECHDTYNHIFDIN